MLHTMPPIRDLTGQRFGRLTVVRRDADVVPGNVRWTCLCKCGKYNSVDRRNLVSGSIRSCGCLLVEFEQSGGARLTHGATRNRRRWPEYYVWAGMIARCEYRKHKSYFRYGGRGIKVCERWRNSFQAFITDMGRRPEPKLTIDRKDNDGNYEPGNCYWATQKQQAANRKPRGYHLRAAPRTQR